MRSVHAFCDSLRVPSNEAIESCVGDALGVENVETLRRLGQR